MTTSMEAVVAALNLEPHPEGGYFREIFRQAPADDSRGSMTAIYYMPPVEQPSRWRVIDADEIWTFHAGAPLTLSLSHDGKTIETHRLGSDFANGEKPQAVVPKGVWASATSHGGWTLVGGICAPAFLYEGFRMAPPGWQPGDLLP